MGVEIPLFVKWAGGKKQLLSKFEEFYPENIEVYREPFVGGGAVFFHVKQKFNPKKIFLSDYNSELINLYVQIRDNLSELIKLLRIHAKNHSKDYYYEARNAYNKEKDSLKKAALLLYLNRTCFNGLFRVNSKNEFNVPIGSYKNPEIVREETLKKASHLLKNVVAKAQDFKKVLETAKKGDFVYLDPPYWPFKKNNFTSYTDLDFGREDQVRLAEVFMKLDAKGCKVMLSNSDSELIHKLYKGYNIRKVKARRSINSDAKGRGEIDEVVVTNY